MEKKLDNYSLQKLENLHNPHVIKLLNKYVILLNPEKITVLTGTDEDKEYIKKLSLKNHEEYPLNTKGHTYHFDGYFDQGRDKEKTRVLLNKGAKISKYINTGEREQSLQEIFKLMKNSMKGKEMFVSFYCLGPLNSKFSIPALQITDSSYVVHSENLLYRPGYQEFIKLSGNSEFFHFIHASGVTEHGISKFPDKKRIYIDLEENRVFSVNTQYAGNSVGLKKLALRLAIKKAHVENWLCEHMFIMGVHPNSGKKRTTYFTGAFPSACGKTSTAMIPGQTIIGDDIAYIRPGSDGIPYAANVEQGIFGIIEDVNPIDDELIYKALTTPREVIFSNILVKEKKPYWLGMGKNLPKSGINYSGRWNEGIIGPDGAKVNPAHKNARYTIQIKELDNADPNLDNPYGVPVSGIIYGGRDSDTSPPVIEAFNWFHGVFIAAALESETTAATIGTTGVRTHNPLANLDFLVIPLGKYISSHLDLGKNLKHEPRIFNTNYFLKDNGKFLNSKVDKKIWLMWMEGRIHDEFEAIASPIGYMPRYEDLKILFKKIFSREYTKNEYESQFSIRISKLLEKLDRIEKIFKDDEGIPDLMFIQINNQRQRLLDAKKDISGSVISPFLLNY